MASPTPLRLGVIGCGSISKAYFTSCRRFANLSLQACADLDEARAREAAHEHGIPEALGVDDLLASPNVDCVVNLTIPAAHAELDIRALEAGKHVFSEKPFGLTLDEGRRICAAAARASRRVGCAPDTVLGAAVQTCRGLLDAGAVGRPTAFTAVMQCGGHESWHPSPEFYYRRGGGPLFDMGPYYLHALITLLGPVRRVAGMTKATWLERVITSEPRNGTVVPVKVPTHVIGLLEFHNGTMGTLVTSFDVKGPFTNPVIEIYGTEGTLRVPDPNTTGGQVQTGRPGGAWEDVAATHPYAEGSRGLGVADMAAALASGRPHRANEQVALHALEIMQALHESAADGSYRELTTTCERPAPMRAGLPDYVLE